MNKNPLEGIITPMATPLEKGGRLIDEKGVEKLVQHLISGGVHGIFALGTTGEAASLSREQRRALITCTSRHILGKIPLLVGISDTAIDDSLDLANFAFDHGATALVLAPPYYYKSNPDELLAYLEQICRDLPLPLLLYNMPEHTQVHIDPTTLAKAAEIPGIVGVKDSSCDMINFNLYRSHLEKREGFSIFMGPDQMVAEAILLGGDGGVCSGSNVFPRLYVDLYEAASRGDLENLTRLKSKVMNISRLLYHLDGVNCAPIKGIKATLSLLNICKNELAPPLKALAEQEVASIKTRLESLELLG